jgi:hypothetical protein
MSKEVRVLDRLENLEPLAEEFMLLYHVNFGYPLLDSGARMVTPERSVEPRTPGAAPGLPRRSSFSEPVDGAGEECFFYDCAADAEGRSHAALLNRELGLGAYVGFDRAKLPILTQWKNPRSHDYAMGIEPGNSYIMGRAKEREHGSLPSIPGYSGIDYDLRLGVLDGLPEMDAFEARMAALT